MPQDLRYSDIRINIERAAGDVLDVAPFLDVDSLAQLVRSEPSPNQPCISEASFTLSRSYNDPAFTESFDYRLNDRFKPGKKVSISIYWDGVWRVPPFAAVTYIKFAYYKDEGTHETLRIVTQGGLARVIEIDKAFDPERKFDAAGNEVPVTRDVLGVTRSLADIINSYLHVKGVGPVVNSAGYMTQTTNAYKEFLADSSDSEINFAQQLVWFNPDRPLELNFLYRSDADQTRIAALPLALSKVTPANTLLNLRWGLYTDNLLEYEPEEQTEQLSEFVEVTGVASQAQQRPSYIVEGGYPQGMQGFSINTPVNPITDTLTTTSINWAGRTIEIEASTWSTAKAVEITSGSGGSVGFGNTLVLKKKIKKEYDARQPKGRLFRKIEEVYVPEVLKTGGSTTTTNIGTPAASREEIYVLSNDDKILQTIVHDTADNQITGATGEGSSPVLSSVNRFSDLGGGAYVRSPYQVANPNLAQGQIPYFASPDGGFAERSQPEQCEYFPDQFYLKTTPVRRVVPINWGGAETGRTKQIDVGNALLTGQNFDLLAESLARWHVSQHVQYNAAFPLTTALFTKWEVPGQVITVLHPNQDTRHYYYSGADSIEISATEIKCRTTLFWIGAKNETSNVEIEPAPVVQTFYLLDESGNVITDENGDRITWSK